MSKMVDTFFVRLETNQKLWCFCMFSIKNVINSLQKLLLIYLINFYSESEKYQNKNQLFIELF